MDAILEAHGSLEIPRALLAQEINAMRSQMFQQFGGAAGGHGFLLLLAGLAEVHVEIDETRCADGTTRVQVRYALGRRRPHSQGLDAPRMQMLLERWGFTVRLAANRGQAEEQVRQFGRPDFLLVGVWAPRQLRFERSMKRARPGDPRHCGRGGGSLL